MRHLRLLIPDLFPPQDIAAQACAGLELPALGRLLSRASESSCATKTLEDSLCEAFGVQGIAPMRAAVDGLDASEGYWLCADPVNMQLQPAQAILLPDVIPLYEEASAICATLNEHFAGMGLDFSAPHPRRWYLRLKAAPQMTTTPLRRAAWNDAKRHQPQGVDALLWQRTLTEVQMLLYAHPLNQARSERGEPMIASLWLWGGGWAAPLKSVFDAAGGDSDLAEMFARLSGVTQPGSLLQMLEGNCESGLWVCEEPGDAMRRGDIHAWRVAMLQMERELAQPLLKALQTGRLQRLTLEIQHEGGARCFELTGKDAWKLWRSARSLARFAV